MTSKERMLAAMSKQQPDMVPVAPDISNMISCRLTGKLFWDIYHKGDPTELRTNGRSTVCYRGFLSAHQQFRWKVEWRPA